MIETAVAVLVELLTERLLKWLKACSATWWLIFACTVACIAIAIWKFA